MKHLIGNSTGEVLKEFRYGAERWELALRSKSGDFLNLKLYSVNRVPRKANYWIALRLSTLCFCRHRDVDLLAAGRSELYFAVLNYLTERYKAIQDAPKYDPARLPPLPDRLKH